MDCNFFSSFSSSPPGNTIDVQMAQAPKRTATDAGLKPSGMRRPKSVKKRASKACQCCRARKVRCNVVEHGAPCTNCRLDEFECVASESKHKKLVPALSEHILINWLTKQQRMDYQRDLARFEEQHY